MIRKFVPAPYQSHTTRPYPTSRTYRQNAGALVPGQGRPYTGEDRHRVLAERIEGLISQEHAKWAASSQQPTQRPTGQP
jgi:hypothetical protein